jgi:hypothetical protein
MTTSDGFNFCHLNAPSIPAHIDQLRCIFNDVPLHVIGVSDTWLKKNTVNAIMIFLVLRHYEKIEKMDYVEAVSLFTIEKV